MFTTIAFFILIASLCVQIFFLVGKKSRPDPVSHFLIAAASALLFGETVLRSIEIRFPALTNTYESLLFYSGVICLIIFIYRAAAREKTRQFILFGGTIIAIVLLAIASSPIAPDTVKPPVPALQSHWLVLHVSFSFIGEGFFVIAFVASIMYLAAKKDSRKKELDRLTYTTIAVGYPIYTAGALIFGAIWAQHAWGRYWNWDPKETWALITWLTYTIYLHVRFIMKGRRRLAAIVSIVGFAFTLFTFFGVNYLLSGLHSYA